MGKQQPTKPTEAELEILQILWQHGPSTVRLVNDQLNLIKETGYTTTLKHMQIMLDKQLLTRDDSQRSHVFTANIKQADTQQQLLDNLLNTAFNGSAMKLVMQALGNQTTTKEELQQIKALIKKIEGEQK